MDLVLLVPIQADFLAQLLSVVEILAQLSTLELEWLS